MPSRIIMICISIERKAISENRKQWCLQFILLVNALKRLRQDTFLPYVRNSIIQNQFNVQHLQYIKQSPKFVLCVLPQSSPPGKLVQSLLGAVCKGVGAVLENLITITTNKNSTRPPTNGTSRRIPSSNYFIFSLSIYIIIQVLEILEGNEFKSETWHRKC